MTKLKAVRPDQAEQPKPKILVYGKSGAGKTWCALDFPSVYFIDTEDGACLPHYTKKLMDSGGVYLGQKQGSLDFETVIDQVKALTKEKHEYKTLVIDSISKLFNTYISDEIERLGSKDQYGASKKLPVAAMRKLIGWLTRVDMNVILIAHEKEEYGIDAKGERTPIGQTFDCWDKLEYELDLCFRIVKAGQSRNSFVRKSRLEQFDEGSFFPWSYEQFASRYGVDVVERETQARNLASDDQLAELKVIFASGTIPSGLEERWLKKASVSGWDEMPYERVEAAINHLKTNHIKGEKENA